jgi:hypothetical protein
VPKSFSIKVAIPIEVANRKNKTAVRRVEYRILNIFFISKVVT